MQMRAHELAHAALLLLNRQGRIHHRQSPFVDHRLVLVHDTLLKELEALMRIMAEPEVHARFIILEFAATGENAAQRNIQRDAEVEGHRWFDRKLIELAHPLAINATSSVTGKRCIDVAVRQDDSSGL